MKEYLKSFIKIFSMVLISLFIIIGGFVAYAISFPSGTPSGEISGGKFIDYFNKILVNTGSTTDGTVKNSNKLGGKIEGDLEVSKSQLSLNSISAQTVQWSGVQEKPDLTNLSVNSITFPDGSILTSANGLTGGYDGGEFLYASNHTVAGCNSIGGEVVTTTAGDKICKLGKDRSSTCTYKQENGTLFLSNVVYTVLDCPGAVSACPTGWDYYNNTSKPEKYYSSIRIPSTFGCTGGGDRDFGTTNFIAGNLIPKSFNLCTSIAKDESCVSDYNYNPPTTLWGTPLPGGYDACMNPPLISAIGCY